MSEEAHKRHRIHPVLKIASCLILTISWGVLMISLAWIFDKLGNHLGFDVAEVAIAVLAILILFLISVGMGAGWQVDKYLRQNQFPAKRLQTLDALCGISSVPSRSEGVPRLCPGSRRQTGASCRAVDFRSRRSVDRLINGETIARLVFLEEVLIINRTVDLRSSLILMVKREHG
jgi:hypothetical protein